MNKNTKLCGASDAAFWLSVLTNGYHFGRPLTEAQKDGIRLLAFPSAAAFLAEVAS